MILNLINELLYTRVFITNQKEPNIINKGFQLKEPIIKIE